MALVGGKRFPANTGGPLDGETDLYVVQCKERKAISFSQFEALALEMERLGALKNKVGLVMAKRSAGRGKQTPWLVIVTAETWRLVSGALPGDQG